MSLTLHYHPLSSFCMKVLVGLYELEVPFDKHLVDLADEAQRAALVRLWPMGKFPVLRDAARDVAIPESSVILEYVDARYARGRRLVPSDPDAALACRLRDRFFDLHVHVHMQKVVTDNLRPDGQRDALGVERAKAEIEVAYDFAETWLGEKPWAVGDAFTLADCAAAPALFYAKRVVPFRERHAHLAAYFDRLTERPSFARVLAEAAPYMAMFPG